MEPIGVYERASGISLTIAPSYVLERCEWPDRVRTNFSTWFGAAFQWEYDTWKNDEVDINFYKEVGNGLVKEN